jgi:tetratricopeptide (TPR) repeat protein
MKTLAGAALLVGVALLDGALMLDGSAAAQNSPRAAILEQAGWDAIDANRLPLAAASFKEAITLDPKNAMLRLGAGLAAYLQRQDTEARQHLEQALVLDPKLSRARIPLAQVWRRQGEFNEAIRQMEIAVAELPGEPGLRDTLDRWLRERDLHERMRLAVGDFFIVSFEGPEDAQLAAQVLDSLTRAYWRICDVFGAFPDKATPVVLYTREQFRDITRSPQWAAAAFDGIIRVPVRGAGEKGDDLDRVLAHEFSHALIRSLATRGLPTWLNEGLASALESDDLSWATTIVERVGKMPSLQRLAAPFGTLSGGDAALAYAVSAVAARRLLDEAGGPAVANLLRDLGEGVDFEPAFERRMQKSLGQFEQSLRPR